MSGAATPSNFRDLVDAVGALPLEDQEILIDIITKRLIQKKREDLAVDIKEAREAYRKGSVKRGTVEDLMRDLGD